MNAIRVLLVDDSLAFLEAATKFLQSLAGVEVVARAASGAEALARAESVKPDLILMDIVMPGITGIDAAGLIRRSCHDSKIVMLTLHSDDAYRTWAAQAGADGFVTKDVLVAELPRVIDALFPGRGT